MGSLKQGMVLFLFSILFLPVFSQEEGEKIVSNQVWLDYYTYYYFKPKWEFYGDIGYRFTPKDLTWQMFHIRPSIRFTALSLWEYSGGVGLFQTVNKDYPNSFEVRPWQGVKLKWPSFEPVYFHHYARLEERIFFPESSPTEYNFRLRYRLGIKIYVFRFPNKNHIFVPGYAEAFVDFGPKIHEVYSNRTRFATRVGYKTHKNWTFQFHFVGQNGRSGDDEQFSTAERLFQFKVQRHLFKKEYRKTKSLEDVQ